MVKRPDRQGRNERPQGHERDTETILYVKHARNTGSPTDRETYGDGASTVLRGRESRPHDEGRRVRWNERDLKVRGMPRADSVLEIHQGRSALKDALES